MTEYIIRLYLSMIGIGILGAIIYYTGWFELFWDDDNTVLWRQQDLDRVLRSSDASTPVGPPPRVANTETGKHI